MTDLTPCGAAARRDTRRVRRSFLFAGALLLAWSAVADAKITIRRDAPHDQFFFHANYSTIPFDPASGFGIEIYNCVDGAAPAFISAREPLVICAIDPSGNTHTLAERIYSVTVPPGACVDHGGSCYFRDATVPDGGPGVRFFRVRYAKRERRNRVWLESYGNLSGAAQARMMIVITIDGLPRAILEDTFRPRPNGGWFSPF